MLTAMDAKSITEHTELKIGNLVMFWPSDPEATREKLTRPKMGKVIDLTQGDGNVSRVTTQNPH